MTESMNSKLARLARACVDDDDAALEDGSSLHVHFLLDMWMFKHGCKVVMGKVDEHALSAWRAMDPRTATECFVALQKILYAFGMTTPSDDFFEIVLDETERMRRPRDCDCVHLMERSAMRKPKVCEAVVVAMFAVRVRVSDVASRWVARALCCKKCFNRNTI